jgi:hypothetical protein
MRHRYGRDVAAYLSNTHGKLILVELCNLNVARARLDQANHARRAAGQIQRAACPFCWSAIVDNDDDAASVTDLQACAKGQRTMRGCQS